jgi:CHAD domain-containing protein
MRDYAVTRTLALMEDLISALRNAASDPGQEEVHKLRVTIRRFQQALRLFEQYLKRKGVGKIKSKLRAVMQIAGELRNRDIAIGLVADAGGNTIALADERAEYDRQFTAMLMPLTDPALLSKWRGQLGLDVDEDSVE